MPTVHWEAEEYRIRFHYSCLKRFDLQIKLRKLERVFKFLIITSAARRGRDGDDMYARRRQFMGLFITYSCIKTILAELSRKRESVIYPSFNSTLVSQLILGGKSTKPCSFFGSDSGGYISGNQWMKWSLQAKYSSLGVARKTVGRRLMFTIILLISAWWLFCSVYHFLAHSRSLLIYSAFHRTEFPICITQALNSYTASTESWLTWRLESHISHSSLMFSANTAVLTRTKLRRLTGHLPNVVVLENYWMWRRRTWIKLINACFSVEIRGPMDTKSCLPFFQMVCSLCQIPSTAGHTIQDWWVKLDGYERFGSIQSRWTAVFCVWWCSIRVVQCMVKSVYHPDDRSFNVFLIAERPPSRFLQGYHGSHSPAEQLLVLDHIDMVDESRSLAISIRCW